MQGVKFIFICFLSLVSIFLPAYLHAQNTAESTYKSAAAFDPSLISKLKKSTGETEISIEKINGAPFERSLNNYTCVGSEISITGWAIDSGSSSIASQIVFKFDGHYYAAKHGIQRDDVADFFKNNALMESGFEISIPCDKTKNGDHNISVYVISMNNYFYEILLPFKISLQNK